MTKLCRSLFVLFATCLFALSACSGPAVVPDPVPEEGDGEVEAEEEKAPMPWEGVEPPDPSPEGWNWQDRRDFGVRFKLPAQWDSNEGNGVFFATPKPPEDDSVIIFMGLDDRGNLDKALLRLDDVFPMTNVRFSIQNQKEQIGGMPMTFGEGIGYSKDFEADLHFFIMLIESGSKLTLMAAFVKQTKFEERSPTIIEIIKSLQPL